MRDLLFAIFTENDVCIKNILTYISKNLHIDKSEVSNDNIMALAYILSKMGEVYCNTFIDIVIFRKNRELFALEENISLSAVNRRIQNIKSTLTSSKNFYIIRQGFTKYRLEIKEKEEKFKVIRKTFQLLEGVGKIDDKEKLLKPLQSLLLPDNISRKLADENIYTVGDLTKTSKEELLSLANINEEDVSLIIEYLNVANLHFDSYIQNDDVVENLCILLYVEFKSDYYLNTERDVSNYINLPFVIRDNMFVEDSLPKYHNVIFTIVPAHIRKSQLRKNKISECLLNYAINRYNIIFTQLCTKRVINVCAYSYFNTDRNVLLNEYIPYEVILYFKKVKEYHTRNFLKK